MASASANENDKGPSKSNDRGGRNNRRRKRGRDKKDGFNRYASVRIAVDTVEEFDWVDAALNLAQRVGAVLIELANKDKKLQASRLGNFAGVMSALSLAKELMSLQEDWESMSEEEFRYKVLNMLFDALKIMIALGGGSTYIKLILEALSLIQGMMKASFELEDVPEDFIDGAYDAFETIYSLAHSQYAGAILPAINFTLSMVSLRKAINREDDQEGLDEDDLPIKDDE